MNETVIANPPPLPPQSNFEPEKPKSNKTMIIAIVAILLMLCCCCVAIAGWVCGDVLMGISNSCSF